MNNPLSKSGQEGFHPVIAAYASLMQIWTSGLKGWRSSVTLPGSRCPKMDNSWCMNIDDADLDKEGVLSRFGQLCTGYANLDKW